MGECTAGIHVPPEDRAVVRFATFELFVVLYLQKLGPGSEKSQIAVPIYVMFAGLVWMILTRRITFSATRLSLYLIFVSCCLFSSILSNTIGSILSIMELFLLYSFMTTSAPLSQAGYYHVLDNFIKMMILPAIIVLVQFGIQRITGHPDPILMDFMLPKSILIQGYAYDANYPQWNSPFSASKRVFLPRTVVRLVLPVVGCDYRDYVFSASILGHFDGRGNGLIARQHRSHVAPSCLTFPARARVAPSDLADRRYGHSGDIPDNHARSGSPPDFPFEMNRISSNVGGAYGTSGGLRLTIPWNRFITSRLLSDPSYLFTGTAAGSTDVADGNAWPILKLTREYGVVTMTSFLRCFFASAFAGRHLIPLKFAAWIIFNFTGGYLLDSSQIITFSILFCIIEPTRSAAANEVRGSVDPTGVAHRKHQLSLR